MWSGVRFGSERINLPTGFGSTVAAVDVPNGDQFLRLARDQFLPSQVAWAIKFAQTRTLCQRGAILRFTDEVETA